MHVLVLGAGGMLGHKLVQRLAARNFAVVASIRGAEPEAELAAALPGTTLLPGVSADDFASVEHAIRSTQPQAVINCIGIIKQLDAAKDPVPSITVNALFPHRLAQTCTQHNARLVHFSTDCVFSGDGGPYTEDSMPDARDLYGRTKLLGEVAGPGALTIRSSIIGHELRGHHGLLDWFVSQQGGEVRGFANALYSGVTTQVMADLVAQLLSEWPDLSGVWQVASEPISKYDLLVLLRNVFGFNTVIHRDEKFFCDRRLDGSRFRALTGWTAPNWRKMVRDLRDDCSTYASFTPMFDRRSTAPHSESQE